MNFGIPEMHHGRFGIKLVFTLDKLSNIGPYNGYEVFLKTGVFLKSATNGRELSARSLEVKNSQSENIGYLIPFSKTDLDDQQALGLLAAWREKNQFAYPTRFKVTIDGTRRWLKQGVIDNAARILFWVTDLRFRPMGHIGVIAINDGEGFEVDNVLRGVDGIGGLMSSAMSTLEAYFEEECSIESFTLRVLGSNHHAIAFYESQGYVETQREPLKLVTSALGETLVPGEEADDQFVTMSKNLVEARPVPDLILTAGPSIGLQERAYTAEAVQSGWNASHSDFLQKFEREFSEYTGTRFAMATSSCTGALHLSLLALGIGPGDEVIVPEITWVATASAVRYVGATPIFCDVDRLTWTMSPESVKSLITENTKAIMPVHLYGFAADMNNLSSLASEFGLYVVEDAAPAIGTTIDGKAAGTFGAFGCYSFQGAKMLVTGEGGMLVTDDEELFARAKKIQDHGRRPGTFWIDELGYKYKMSNLTASLGLGQLHRSEQQIERKTRIRGWYEDELMRIPGISFQEALAGSRSIHWMTSITLPFDLPLTRDDVIAKLRQDGVDSRPVFPAISQYEFWPTRQRVGQVAKAIGDRSINLPSGVNLSRSSVAKVGKTLRGLLS
jgi:perosamine synthetase